MSIKCPEVLCAGLQAILEWSGASPREEESLIVGDSLKLFRVSSEALQGLNSCLFTSCLWEVDF